MQITELFFKEMSCVSAGLSGLTVQGGHVLDRSNPGVDE